MTQVQITLDNDMLSQLDAAAETLSISREDALKEAILNFTQWGRSFKEDVMAGIASAERGELISDNAIRKEFAALRAAATTGNK